MCSHAFSKKKPRTLNQKTQDHERFDDSLEMLFSVMQIFFLQFHDLCDIFIIMQLTSVSRGIKMRHNNSKHRSNISVHFLLVNSAFPS